MKKAKCNQCDHIQDFNLKHCENCQALMPAKEFKGKSNTKLIDPKIDSDLLVHYECKSCGYTGLVAKWKPRTTMGILLLLFYGIFPGVIVLTMSNPYYCPSCFERHKLLEVYNDGEKQPIRCMTKKNFLILTISILASAIFIPIILTANT